MAEPTIIINGRTLTDAQAMAVRVALTHFYSQLGYDEILRDWEPIGEAYRARIEEVLSIILGPPPRPR